VNGIVERTGGDDPGTTPARPLRQLLAGEVHLLPWLLRFRVAIILALGVLFRVAQYLADRGLWLDEQSLALNINGKTLADLFGTLEGTQLAPPAFLVIEWLAVRVLGNSPFSLRLFPLICAIASLYLFSRVSVRVLRAEAVLIAVGLFVLADDLIYYASEFKQYSTDVAVTLACDLLALRIASGEATRSRLTWFAAIGAVGVWFSHPAAFVLAGVGTVLITLALLRGQHTRARGLSLVSLVWLVSFAGAHTVSRRHLGGSRALWKFWDFAFPPWPPASAGEVAWPVRRMAFFFANPVNFDTPMGAKGSALLALALFLAGCVSLCNRGRRDVLAMLTAPIVVTMAAAYLRLYPFHGRLVLFLVPSSLLLIAEGVARVLEAAGSRPFLRGAVLAFVFVLPVLYALGHLADPRDNDRHTAHGDRRPASLEPAHFPF
jgi:hypothetical protein